MTITIKIASWLSVLSLPLGVAGIVHWTTGLVHPWRMVALSIGLTILLAGLIYGLLPRFLPQYTLYRKPIALMTFFYSIPILAILSGLNLTHKTIHPHERLEIMSVYKNLKESGVYLFLWEEDGIHKHKVGHEHPAAQAEPGDSLDIYLATGLLGFKFTNHVDLAL